MHCVFLELKVISLLFFSSSSSPPPAVVELQAQPDHRPKVRVFGRGGLQDHHLWGQSVDLRPLLEVESPVTDQ